MSRRRKHKMSAHQQAAFDACVELLRVHSVCKKDQSVCKKDVAKKAVENIHRNHRLARLIPQWLFDPDETPIIRPKLKGRKAAKGKRNLDWPPREFAGGKWHRAREQLEALEYHLLAANWTLRQLDPGVLFDLANRTKGDILCPAEIEGTGHEGPSLALDMERVAASCVAVYDKVDRPKGGAQERDFSKIVFLGDCKKAWKKLCGKPASYSEASPFREFIEYAWEAITGTLPTDSEFDRTWRYLRKNDPTA